MLEDLKTAVCQANRLLAAGGLVHGTFGNVSGVDRAGGHVAIKPSGVPYDQLEADQIVIVSLDDGSVVEGELHPSSDTPTHRRLYQAFASIGGIVHTHSLYATAWAQARRDLPCFGTTHADYFHGSVPCTRPMTPEEIQDDYEANTGKVIVERFAKLRIEYLPGVLVANHGPFAWGATPQEAVHHAEILEHLARLASETLRVDAYPKPIQSELLDKHFFRKHGPDAYYGQD